MKREWITVQCPGGTDDFFIEPFDEDNLTHYLRIHLHPRRVLLHVEHIAIGKDYFCKKAMYRILEPDIDFPLSQFIPEKNKYVWFFTSMIPNHQMILLREKIKSVPNYLHFLRSRELGL